MLIVLLQLSLSSQNDACFHEWFYGNLWTWSEQQMSSTTCTITKIENIWLNGPYWRYGSHFETYTNLPPENPIIVIWNNRIQNGWCIAKKVHQNNDQIQHWKHNVYVLIHIVSPFQVINTCPNELFH